METDGPLAQGKKLPTSFVHRCLMPTRRPRPRPGRARPGPRSGIALLLSVIVLMVVIAIVFQIQISTMTSARVARNDVGLTSIDLAIESAALEVFQQLIADGEAAAPAAGAPEAGGMPGGAGAGAPEGAGGEQPAASDSREDEWARPQRPEVNGIQMRVLVQDEDSKYNVLNMLAADEEAAEQAFEIVKRILDQCREGTREDISAGEAEDMARAMRDFMEQRDRFGLARPELLTANDEKRERVLLQSLRELLVLPAFEERHFRDYRDVDGRIVHSIGSFLTIWSSPATLADLGGAGGAGGGAAGGAAGQAGGAPGQAPGGSSTGRGAGPGNSAAGAQGGRPSGGAGGSGGAGARGGPGAAGDPAGAGPGAAAAGAGQAGGADSTLGYGVNVNTAPVAVLVSLFDRRDVSTRFWDDVIDYRNQKQDPPEGETAPTEAIYDEYGREIVPRKFFESLEKLTELDGWSGLATETQTKVNSLLTTQSNVFSIFITARRSTSNEEDVLASLSGEERAREEEEAGSALVRTVRIVVWRRSGQDGAEVVPIVPWEIVDHAPFELLDYPDDRR